ncbi:MAG: DUF58 domain-containing protein [Actinomycetaceae bacterium]|nr:DUF58 domain-containing protein [Actinomycetaceae bacterium]
MRVKRGNDTHSRLTISAAGWVLIAFIVCAGALTWFSGWQGLASMVVVAVCALLIGFVTVLRPVTFHVDIDVPADRVVVGKVCVAQIVVRAGGRESAPTVIDLPVGDATATFLVPRLKKGQEWRESFLIPTSRRQVLVVGPAIGVRSDGLSLVSRDTVLSGEREVFVHPATVLPDYDAVGLLRDIEGVTTEKLSPSDASFHALRDYVSGDDRRFVHWPTTARLGRLVVRQFEETRRSHHVVIVDTRAQSYGGRVEDTGELALSLAASFGVEAIIADRAVTVWSHAGRFRCAVPSALLDDFTRTQFESEGARLATVVHEAVTAVPQASAVTIVTGKAVPQGEVLRAVREIPLSTHGLVIRTNHRGRPKRSTVGGVDQFILSSLDDIRRVSRVASP